MLIVSLAEYIQAVSDAIGDAGIQAPAMATIHADERPIPQVLTGELVLWGTGSDTWPGVLRLCWHSGRGWWATGERPGPGVALGVPAVASPEAVAANLRHLLIHGPRSCPPPRVDLWERRRELGS